MDIDSALEKIYSLKQFHIKLGLDNIDKLLKHIGNPEKNIKAFHIAGSNGKGSTCAFMSSILQEYGYKVGLFSSPHLVRFNERIKINGKEIDDNEIINFLERNKNYIQTESPTFFEITTAMAFDYFDKQNVDYAIVETGLGGRLDATNMINPLASVITTISLEHSHILGDSLLKIASEKAGIIKNNTDVFLGLLPTQAENVIVKIAKEKKSKVFKLKESITSSEPFKLKIGDFELFISQTGLKGDHQKVNASLATLCLVNTLDLKDTEKITAGFDNVIINTGIRGRYEYYGKKNNIIFDAAHNTDGVKSFLSEFQKEQKQFRKRKLIFGAMKDKDIGIMLQILNENFDEIMIASINEDRAAKFNDIKNEAITYNIRIKELRDPVKYIKTFAKKNEDDILCILGSIYLLGMIQKNIKN